MPEKRQLTEKEKRARRARRARRRRRRRIQRFFRCTFVLLVFLALVGGIAYLITQNNQVYRKVRVEAGTPVVLADLLKKPDETAAFVEGHDQYDTNVPGQYVLKIKSGAFSHKCVLTVEDTVSPVLTVKNFQVGMGQTCEPSDFVEQATDATQLTFSYSQTPNFDRMGDQQVTIIATDLGNNVAIGTATLSIWPISGVAEIEAGTEMPAASAFLLPGDESEISYVYEPGQVPAAATETEAGTEDAQTSVSDDAQAAASEPDAAMTDAQNNAGTDGKETHVGDYPAVVLYKEKKYNVIVRVVDTTAPVVTGQDVEGYNIAVRDPAEFIASCEDATTVTYSYQTTPDFNQIGTQQVTVIATDEGGNTATVTASMTLQEDTEDPVIEGAVDQTVALGSTISYKSIITAKDNNMEGLKLDIDSSQVNINEVGTYPVTCTATDAAGHSVSASFQVTVQDVGYTVEEVNAMADKALASCITADMTEKDKVTAIFWYVRNHIGYYDHSDKSSWVKAAGDAFTSGQGDCYSYACVSKVLLDRAGITNMDIERIRKGDSMHFWNLVDIHDGHGWYHFDTTPRASEHPTILLWDDATLMAYSERNNGSHNYDKSLYPDIP